MKNTKSIIWLAILASAILLGGCDDKKNQNVEGTPIQKTPPVNYHGEPFSSGPTVEDKAKKPSSNPKEMSQTSAQAVTQNENIKLTLPLKTD